MNNILSKLLFAFLILFASNTLHAQIFDTTLLAVNNSVTTPATFTNIKIANVVFPSSLEKHKEASISYIQKYSDNKREYLIRMYQKGKKFFPKIVTVFKKYNLPQELKVLIALESAFSANAVSLAGAVGYWQMMDDVAKEYGLQIITATDKLIKSKKKDDRNNFSKSTIAAAKYLRDRSHNFNNDVLLMAASYNCGAGNVRQAMKRSGKINPDFWDIKKFLPAETRNYVMNFIALSVIFKNYEKFAKKQLVFNNEMIKLPSSIGTIKPNVLID